MRMLRLQSDRPAALQPRPISHTDNSWSPLTYAAAHGEGETCELLLWLKADVNKKGCDTNCKSRSDDEKDDGGGSDADTDAFADAYTLMLMLIAMLVTVITC